MNQAHLFLIGLLAVGLAAVWYDDRNVQERAAPTPAAGVAVR